MTDYEPFMSPAIIARKSGFPVEAIRAWCRRSDNPLPHVESGNERRLMHIRWSVFCEWVDREQHR